MADFEDYVAIFLIFFSLFSFPFSLLTDEAAPLPPPPIFQSALSKFLTKGSFLKHDNFVWTSMAVE